MTVTEPVEYMARSRDYYAAHGYDKPYVWAHHEDIPFTRLNKPLSDCTLTIVTTGMPDSSYRQEHRRLAIGDLNRPPTSLFTDELAWDKEATHTNDINSYFPYAECQRRIAAGELGKLSDHYYCIATNYSQRRTIERDAPKIVASCLEDEVDVAILVPL